MKIETKVSKDDYYIEISEFYSGLSLITREGKRLNICLRDMGFEMNLNGGKWHHISKETDFKTTK